MYLFPEDPSITTTPSAFATAVEEASQLPNPYPTPAAFQAAVQAAVQAAIPAPADTTNRIAKWKVLPVEGWGYCWSHGLLRSKTHNSCTYKFKASGHKDEATLENRMGGKNHIWRSRI